MRASEIMTRPPIAVREDVTIDAIMRVLVRRKISGVLVVTADGVLSGVVSERDVMLQHSMVTSATDVMTIDVITAAPEAPVDDLARTLLENGIKRIPIVQDGRPIGIVSRRDILLAKLGLIPQV